MLAEQSGIPTFVTSLAQGFINESLPNFGGLYAGAGSNPDVEVFIQESDLVLHIGPFDTEVSTYFGSTKLRKDAVICLHADHVESDQIRYPDVDICDLLNALLVHTKNVEVDITAFPKRNVPWNFDAKISDTVIKQDYFWHRLSSWLQIGDIILTDTGTASFGIYQTSLPPESQLINISLWASIGYSLPAGQGAALAARDMGEDRRTVILQGDGSFQLTCQEISTMIKNNLRVTM